VDDDSELIVEKEGTETIVAEAGSIDVSGREDVQKLRKHAIGLAGVLFLTVTGSAPISAMLFNTPIAVGFGNGIGTPAAFLVATIVLTIFSVAYVAMARKKTTAGGFYSYISHGLGRELGMATGLSSVVAYSVFEASLCGGFAFFLNDYIKVKFNVNIAWPWLALAMVVIISLIAYFDVRLSARVLGVGLITEILILLIMDVGVFSHGPHHVSMAAVNPVNAFKGFPAVGALVAGAAGIGLFFAFWSWVGFEMAPNYGEESKDPKRIVPLAMYISVVGLGIFYVITSWASISGYPSVHAAINQAQTGAADFFFIPNTIFVGKWATEIMRVLIITGSFACGMAFHNTAARYFYSLGREGVIPGLFGRTHKQHASPHVASLIQSGIAALIVIAFALGYGSGDPTKNAYIRLYGLMAVMGVIIILAVQALVSLAIFMYFEREHPTEVHWWKTRLAPIIAFVTQAYVLYLLFKNISFLGSGEGLAKWLGPIDLVIFLIGLGAALYWKRSKPDRYAAIGRMIHEGL
jgi:amino acid transporter